MVESCKLSDCGRALNFDGCRVRQLRMVEGMVLLKLSLNEERNIAGWFVFLGPCSLSFHFCHDGCACMAGYQASL